MLHPLPNSYKKKNIESGKHHKLAVLSWYVVFLLFLPIFIRNIYAFENLRYYFPMVDLIANSFSASGGVDSLFKDLYSLSPNNITSFLSTNFINLIALMGVSWNGIRHAFEYNSLWVGVTVTIFMYMITYLAPTQMIPYVVNHVQQKLDAYTPLQTDVTIFGKTFHLEDYISSFIVIFVLVAIEFFFVTTYINFVKTL